MLISAAGHVGLLLAIVFETPSEPTPDIRVAEVELVSASAFAALQEESAPAPETAPEEAAAESESVAEEELTFEEPSPAPESEAVDRDAEALEDDREVSSVADEETRIDEAARQSAPRIADDAAPEPEALAFAEEESASAVAEPSEDSSEQIEFVELRQRPRTSTETVTEAEETDATALKTTRPRRRPPSPRVDSEPDDAADGAQVGDGRPEVDVAALIEAAENERRRSETADRRSALTAGERNRLRETVGECWNIGALSDEARRTVVTVGLQLDRRGRPVSGTIRRISASGGNAGSQQRAFEAGRRAILRCLSNGIDLPAERYERWQNVEIVFNPEDMRLR